MMTCPYLRKRMNCPYCGSESISYDNYGTKKRCNDCEWIW